MSEKLTVLIRVADAQDSEALSQLAIETYRDAYGHTMPADEMEAHFADNLTTEHAHCYITQDVVLLAEYNTRLIGFAHISNLSLKVSTDEAESKSLRRLYVHRDYQTHGVGSTLMQAALEHPLLKQARYIYLTVWEHNPGAQRLYNRFGFKVVDQRRFIMPSGAIGDFDYIMMREQ